MEFEWSRAKADANRRKHGITFELAAAVFDDPRRLDFADDREAYGEERLSTIGRIGRRILSVVFVERENRIRIISAREATRDERQQYHALSSPPGSSGERERRGGGAARRPVRGGDRGGGRRLGLTQGQFARRYRLPVGTVRDWEQGRTVSDAPARALLRAIDGEPDVLAKVLTR